MSLPVSYTTVSKMLLTIPMVGSISTITSENIAAFAGRAEAVINASISRRYSLPLTGTFPLLETIATDLGLYYLLSRRVFTQERMNQSEWPERLRESLDLLKMLAEGVIGLVNTSGDLISVREDLAPVFSDKMTFHPTIDEGPSTAWVPDVDKIEDIFRDKDDDFLFDIIRK